MISKFAVLDALRQIRDYGPRNYNVGICGNLTYALRQTGLDEGVREALEILHFAAGKWPEYSGSPEFPVPHNHTRAEKAYYLHSAALWDATPYGDARRRLLAFCIATLESEVAHAA